MSMRLPVLLSVKVTECWGFSWLTFALMAGPRGSEGLVGESTGILGRNG
jgi:hypothetical protein